MKKTSLVIMAAGIGSRYGKGIKQLAAVGPKNQIIMDYSIKDALDAGFNKIVFIIRKDIEEEFHRVIGGRIGKYAEVAYAFQEMSDLPEGFSVPEGRVKPWGTGQAVLCARNIVHEPFAVINADDYYGKEAYRKVHDYLVQEREEDGVQHICMAGFILGNTLSENGGVTRGICRLSDGCLSGVDETKNIFKTKDGAQVRKEDGTTITLDPGNLVSMNMWGFTPAFMEMLEEGFTEFLQNAGEEMQKKEFLVPVLVDQLIKAGRIKVDVLKSRDQWFGVTYQEDRASVVEAFRQLTDQGKYPEEFFA
ncbi:MAG: nucleotidyltransferase [Blautia sp.]|nr:nucleotidyltransferase [Blautia sp.]